MISVLAGPLSGWAHLHSSPNRLYNGLYNRLQSVNTVSHDAELMQAYTVCVIAYVNYNVSVDILLSRHVERYHARP